MIWRGLIFFFAITTSLLFAWSGFSWALDGQGIHPTIAFPIAAVIHFLAYFWMAREADQAGVAITEYLEWLDHSESMVNDLKADYHGDSDTAGLETLKGAQAQIGRSKKYWADTAERHLQ